MPPYRDPRPLSGQETRSEALVGQRLRFVLPVSVAVFVVALLVYVDLTPTTWATPDQERAILTIPTRTPDPINLTLVVTLQRPNSPPPSPPWAVPVHLAFFLPGDATALVYETNVVLDQSGRWAGYLNLPLGSHDVRVKNLHTLRNVKRNVVLQPNTTIDMGTLREGDADNDNRVRASDFAILRAAYFTNAGSPQFDGRADFDEDKRIRSSDFALLRGNYFASGDIEVAAVAALGVAVSSNDTVALALEPASVAVAAGEVFTLTLMAHAGPQAFVGLDVQLDFPPEFLQVVGPDGAPAAAIEPIPPLEALANQVDPVQGRILYGAGSFDDPVNGDVAIAYVRFRALKSAADVVVTLSDATVADADGRFVTGPLSGAHIAISAVDRHFYLPMVWKAP